MYLSIYILAWLEVWEAMLMHLCVCVCVCVYVYIYIYIVA